MARRSRDRGREGFSLAEAVLATSIVGIGIAALLTSVGAGTRTNAAGRDMTQATFLAQEFRELTLKLPWSDPDLADQGNPPGSDGAAPETFVDDLDDLLNGVTYTPPRNGYFGQITDMPGWSQQVTFTWRSPSNPATVVSPGPTDLVHIQMDVLYNGNTTLTTGWLTAKK